MAQQQRKQVSDGNGGTVEVTASTALIIERIDNLKERFNIHVTDLQKDVTEIKSNVSMLFDKQNQMQETIHKIDKESAVNQAENKIRTKENTNVREWVIRGLITLVIGALATWISLTIKG